MPVVRRYSVPLGALAMYGVLTGFVVFEKTQPTEAALLASVASSRTPDLTEAALAVTRLGDVWILTVVSLLTVTALAFRSRRAALFVAASVAGAAVIHYALKAITARPRPTIAPLFEAGGWSFPSGHAMATFCFLFALALVIPPERSRTRTLAFVAVAGAVVAVGLTRVYLGVHYPTDVIAGWALGLSWVAVLHSRLQPGGDAMAKTEPSL
jgi:undecaprenyl-diphosphatase